ncbi:N-BENZOYLTRANSFERASE PROTEIN putative-RELATED [Salix viminalis]|uniref:N-BENZOYLTRANSFERASE PROTEIN putative-RELATED n=1 Tax=Salix viminalis TaxID=40686 RepID=A0A9Q0SDW9_SALVM|nr:N-BENZOYLTRANSFERASE PROTEIN putative-RELATED [Salix viminalis]
MEKGFCSLRLKADSAMDDFVDLKRSDELPQLIPTVDYSRDISSYPLLVLQVTRFRCGGVCLGVGWHHILADGTGSFHFINTWSEIARGLPIKTPPYFDRAILRGRVPPSLPFHHVEYDPFPTINTPSQNPIPMSGSRDISRIYGAVYAKARGLSDDQLTKLHIATDGRKRFRPPIPPGYFGNVIFSASPIALSGGLLSESLVHTAERLHRAIKRMDDEYLRSAVDYLEKLGELTAVMRNSETYRSPNLSIVNWVNLPFYDADFGWGKPGYIRPAFAYQGKGYILPSSSGDGTLSLTICLETDHLKSFQKLFYESPKRSCL